MAALALGWGLLFYGQSLGLSVPIFVLLLLAALATLSRLSHIRAVRPNL
jgi:hypothetical protein